jgi:hypothetical protein
MRSDAAFAHLCRVAPIPASSGKTRRHRLNRGGDRAANNALYTVVLARLRLDERTHANVARRTARREIIRCLQRYVARELYQPWSLYPRPRRPGRLIDCSGWVSARSGVEAPAAVHDHRRGRGHHQNPMTPM